MHSNKVYPQFGNSVDSTLHIKTNPPHTKSNRISQEKIVGGSENRICEICQQERMDQDMVVFGSCGHFFCFQCVDAHINERMKLNQNIICCSEGCNGKLNLKRTRHSSKKLTYAGRLTRQAKTSIKIYNKNYQNAVKKCPICQYNDKKQKIAWCKTCQTEFIQIPLDFKRCKGCRRIIEKQKGCDHVKCICGHEFCFLCSQAWDKNHICEHKIPKRTGFSYLLCFMLKLPLYVIIGTFLVAMLVFLSSLICLLSASFFGMFFYIKMIDKLSKSQTISGSIKFLLFMVSIVSLPILISVCALPGFFLPTINLFYKEKIFLQPNILQEIAISLFGCLGVLKLL